MNLLIAKIRDKGRAGMKYRKILSDQAIYTLPEGLASGAAYDPNTLLADGEWFVIEGFSQRPFCLPLLTEEYSSIDFDLLSRGEFTKLDYLCSMQGDSYFFQKISRAQLAPKGVVYFGEQYEYKENSQSIAIHSTADAIYLCGQDALYFQKLPAITSIFKGIDELHREATEEETNDFLQQDFISLRENFCASDVKTANRKRIALAKQTLDRFQGSERQAVFSYIKGYCPALSFTGDAFSIASEDELKQLLFGIEERYYTTPVGGERRCANSVVILS